METEATRETEAMLERQKPPSLLRLRFRSYMSSKFDWDIKDPLPLIENDRHISHIFNKSDKHRTNAFTNRFGTNKLGCLK